MFTRETVEGRGCRGYFRTFHRDIFPQRTFTKQPFYPLPSTALVAPSKWPLPKP